MTTDRPPSTLSSRLRRLMDARTVGTKASALVAGKWVQDAFGFLLLLWLARTNPSGFGLFVFGAGVAALIRSFLTLGLDQFTIRELAWDSNAQGRVLGQMIRLKLLIGLPLLAAVLALGWLKDWNRTETLVVLIISAGQVLLSVADTLFSFYRYAGIKVQEAACSVKAALMGALYGALALLAGGGVAAVSLFVVITHGLKILLATLWGIRTGVLPRIRWARSILPPGRLKAMLLIGAVSFLSSFYIQIQVLLLKHLKAVGEVALYGVATELAGGLASMVSTFVIGGVLYPGLARAAARGSEQFGALVHTYFWRLTAFGLGITFFFVTLGQDLVLLLYGTGYTGSVMPLRILGLAALFSLVNNLFIFAFLAQNRERLLVLLHLAPTLLSLALGPVLIPRLGAGGAALNLLACRIILSLLILAVAQRHYGIFSRGQVAVFSGAGLILGGAPVAWWALGFPFSRLTAVFVLLAYGWWAWRWTTNSRILPKAEAGEHYATD